MKMGLLWFDDNARKSIVSKIDEGADCYRGKFGHSPNVCHVNPLNVVRHARLEVVPNPLIQPNHFWLGVEEDGAANPGGRAGSRCAVAER